MTKSNWKDHEGFLAFMALLLAIIGLMILSSSFDKATSVDVIAQAKIRIIDSTVTGLVAILGMAAQALFRVNQTDKDLAAAARVSAEKVPPVSGETKEALDEIS